jgi:tetratricopeptide (TPR) repeat protein
MRWAFVALAAAFSPAFSATAGAEPQPQQPAQAADGDLTELRHGFEALEAWRVDEARAIAERAYTQDPESPLVLALVADVKLHMSDYAGAVDFFARAREGGAPNQLLLDAPLAEAARIATQDYAETVGEHFIIRYQPGKDAILVPYAMETLELAREKIGKLLGWLPEARIVVEFYPGTATLSQVSTLTKEEIKNSGTIALCKWNRLMVTSPRAVVYGYTWRDTIAHELTHLIIGGASRNTVPIWLHEGIAKFSETAWRERPGLALSTHQQQALRNAAKKGSLIPFAKMHPSMAKLKSQEETSLAFAEVFTFIEYLVELKGYDGLREVLARMAKGSTDVEAIESVFGTPLDSLEARWSAALKNREVKKEGTDLATDRAVVLKDRPDAPDDAFHGLNKAARRYARAADLLFARGRIKAAERELEKAYAETRSPELSRKLAVVAQAAGDLDAAEIAAKNAVLAAPDLAGPNVTLAEILIQKNKLAEAREPLDRAIAVYPFDPRIHRALGAVLAKDGAGAAEERAHARLALDLLTGQASMRAPVLGSGARIEVAGVPFSRVYVERGAEGSEAAEMPSVATGRLTPTSAFKLRPGAIRLRLVPPVGPPIVRAVTVTPSSDDGAPQRFAPAMEGS